MNMTKLKKYVAKHGQSETARRVLLTQAAIWRMLKSKRVLYVVEHDSGLIEIEEHKKIGGGKSAA